MEVSVNNLPSDLAFPEGKGALSYPLATSYSSLLLPERLFVLREQFTGCYLIFVPCRDLGRVLSSDKQEALPLQSGELWKPRALICRQRLAQLVFSLREKCDVICIKGVLSKHVIWKPPNLKTNNNNKKTPPCSNFHCSKRCLWALPNLILSCQLTSEEEQTHTYFCKCVFRRKENSRELANSPPDW